MVYLAAASEEASCRESSGLEEVSLPAEFPDPVPSKASPLASVPTASAADSAAAPWERSCPSSVSLSSSSTYRRSTPAARPGSARSPSLQRSPPPAQQPSSRSPSLPSQLFSWPALPSRDHCIESSPVGAARASSGFAPVVELEATPPSSGAIAVPGAAAEAIVPPALPLQTSLPLQHQCR